MGEGDDFSLSAAFRIIWRLALDDLAGNM